MINTLGTLIKLLTTIVYLLTRRTSELFSAGRSIAFAVSLLVIIVNSVLTYIAIGYQYLYDNLQNGFC